jgi:uncharacterized membrane protein YvbJ
LRSVSREGVSPVCPSCGAETEAGSPKCVRCGHDLLVDRGPASVESTDTTIFAMCTTCGERLDTGSLYCKGCGSAVYNGTGCSSRLRTSMWSLQQLQSIGIS